ncbi:hypothetical protein ACOMHN_029292 [Nucella lapillus]
MLKVGGQRVGNLHPPHCLTRVEHGKGFSNTSTREDHPPLASRGNFVPPQDVTGVQHGNGFSEMTTRSAILQLTSTGNLLPPHREARMQHGVNHTVTSTLGGLLSLAHRLAQVHQRMTSTRGPRPGSEWTNLPPPLHLTDGRHGIFGVTSTRKGHLPLREAPFLAWKGVRAGALLPPPLPLAVVRHLSASFRVMSTLGGGGPSLPSPTGRRADGGQYRSDGKDRGPPSSSSLAPGTQGTQGRPQRHVYTGTGGRNSPRDATLAERRASTGRGEDPLCRHPDSKARGARGGPDTSRQTGLSDYLGNPSRKSMARATRGGGRQSSVSDSDRNLRPTSVRLSKKI